MNTPIFPAFHAYPAHEMRRIENRLHTIVPELQRRGLFRTEYPGTTLRDTLGLPRPAIHSWRKNTDKNTERRRA